MTLKEELQAYAKKTHRALWSERDGQKVPEAADLRLDNDAVKVEGAVLYADLAESTALVAGHSDWFAAEVYKNYLYCAARVIRANGGVITAYDGDRIMAVFLGGSKNTAAAKAGLQINWTVSNILQPAINAQYPDADYGLEQKIGIDVSSLLVARTGIRGSNDLVWVGPAANNAAKLATLSSAYPTYVTATTYSRLKDSSKYGPTGTDMWTDLGSSDFGYRIYGSRWIWSL